MIILPDYPGGPGAYAVEQSNSLTLVLCNCVYLTLTWFQDALLVDFEDILHTLSSLSIADSYIVSGSFLEGTKLC